MDRSIYIGDICSCAIGCRCSFGVITEEDMVGSGVGVIIKVVPICCKFALKEDFSSFSTLDVELSSGKIIA